MGKQKFDVLSFEVCKKLKAAGFPQTGTFLAYNQFNVKHPPNLYMVRNIEGYNMEKWDTACPTFEEIWAELPPKYYRENNFKTAFFLKMDTDCIFYQGYDQRRAEEFNDEEAPFKNSSLTKAAAEMWLTLKTQGII